MESRLRVRLTKVLELGLTNLDSLMNEWGLSKVLFSEEALKGEG